MERNVPGSMVRRLVVWTGLRHAWRAPALTLLPVAGIALGVAVFVAVRAANWTVVRTFAATVDAIAGRANLEVAGATGLPDSLYRELRRFPGVEAATPLMTATAVLPDYPGRSVDVVGVDSFSNGPFRSYDLLSSETDRESEPTAAKPLATREILRWIADPRGALLPRRFAETLALGIGDSLRILVRSRPDTLVIAGLLQFEGAFARTEQSLVVLDIAAAQEMMGKIGRLDRIDLVVAGPDSLAAVLPAALVARGWPSDAEARRPRVRPAQVETMLGAFRLNLTALSLVSLLVGVFIVGNAAMTSVVRRRSEIGMLRAIGASRRMIRDLVLAENLLLGVLGVAAGLGFGLLLARWLLESVANTVSALYVQVAVRELFVRPRDLVIAGAAGMGAVIAGAWMPAREASRLEPQRVLTEGRYPARRRLPIGRLLCVSAAAYALAAIGALSRLSTRHPGAGFAAAFLIIIAGALAAPAAAAGAAAVAAPLARSTVSARLAVGQLRTALRRDSVTVAALGSALAMAIGVSIMVESFRRTVDLWIGQTVQADLYISSAAQRTAGAGAVLDPVVLALVEALPGVRAVDRLRMFEVRDTAGGQPAWGRAVIFSVLAREAEFHFRKGDAASVFTRAASRDEVVVSEPFARHRHLVEGDTLHLMTPSGIAALPIAGVYYDYTSDNGIVLIDLDHYQRRWGDGEVNSLAVYLKDGADAGHLRDVIGRRLQGHALLVRSHQEIRQAALAQFDQTFAVTTTLKVIALVVAWAGAFFSLTAGVAERRSELGILRAIGAAPRTIRRALLAEAVLMGGASFVVGAATGVALALLLVFVINPQFFGWTILWAPTPRPFIEALAVVMAASLAAAWLPARAAFRTDPAASFREE